MSNAEKCTNPRSRAPAAWALCGLCLLTLVVAEDRLPSIPPPPKDIPKRNLSKVIEVLSPTLMRVDRDGAQELVTLRSVTVPGPDEHIRRAESFVRLLLSGEGVYLEFADETLPATPETARPAFVYRAPDGLCANLELVRQGYAAVARDHGNRHEKIMLTYERFARDAGKGIWSPAGPEVTTSRPVRSAASQPASAPALAPQEADSPVVYVTPKGTRFHLAKCRHATGGTPISVAEARQRGLKPCAVCKPPP